MHNIDKKHSEHSDANLSKELEGYLNLYRYRVAARFLNNCTTLLDIGTGYGYGPHYLDSTLYSALYNSVGIDVSIDSLRHANKHYKGEKRIFMMCSGTHLPFRSEIFDIITCFEVIEHLSEPFSLIRGINNTLKTTGRLIISTPNRYTLGSLLKHKKQNLKPQNPFHQYEYSIKEFKLLLNENFYILYQQGIYTPNPIFERIKFIRNSYCYIRFSCHAFSLFKPLCRYQLYVCKKNRKKLIF